MIVKIVLISKADLIKLFIFLIVKKVKSDNIQRGLKRWKIDKRRMIGKGRDREGEMSKQRGEIEEEKRERY